MKNSLNQRSLHFPVFATFVILTLMGLSGCKSSADCDPPIDLEKVKPHVISIDEARKMTRDFRTSVNNLNTKCPEFKDSLQFGLAEAFNCDAMYLLLKQRDSNNVKAAGIRIYFGRDSSGKVKFVLVPTDIHGNDIINRLIAGDDKTAPGVTSQKLSGGIQAPGQTIEQGQLCPTACDDGGSGLGGK